MKTITFDEHKFVLVPIEPTIEMLDRGHNEIDFERTGQNTYHLSHESQTAEQGTTIEQDMRDAWAVMIGVKNPL